MKKLREGDLIGTFEGHEDGINCLAIAADESVLVSGSEDGTARIWDLEAVDEATKGPFKYYVIKILTFLDPNHPVCNQTLSIKDSIFMLLHNHLA